MKYDDGIDVFHSHPDLRVVVTEDDRVLRIARACLVPVTVVNTGKNGKPYPAANVQKANGKWTFKTLARLVLEARTGRVLPREVHAHHGEGRKKSEIAFGATAPLDEVTHGRESNVRRRELRPELYRSPASEVTP